jgi:hypothetical protein
MTVGLSVSPGAKDMTRFFCLKGIHSIPSFSKYVTGNTLCLHRDQSANVVHVTASLFAVRITEQINTQRLWDGEVRGVDSFSAKWRFTERVSRR